MTIDTHAHLEMAEFDNDREAVLARAWEAGLAAIVTVGTTLPDCERAVALAERHAPVYGAVGIHPHEVKEIAAGTYERLRQLARRPKVVALGEIGLDFFYDHSPREIQLRCFGEQMALAAELKLPVIIHDREAHSETLAVMKAYAGRVRGVLHCFSGDWAMAKECLALGYDLSIAGPVTYKKSLQLQEVARRMPLERMVVETDCPFLSPQSHRGKRNEPAYVVETATFIAGLRGIPAAEVQRQTADNARRLFGF
ncbi:MAG: TatD family hydrolase [Deltaproteobacteria bacterium]|nr:TatD family hydrolase [Deltaproteobacteria bacterium]